MSLTQVPPDVFDEILGHLPISMLLSLAYLCKSFLPYVQRRLYRALDINPSTVKIIAANSLHLLAYTQVMQLTYAHRDRDAQSMCSLFSALAKSRRLQGLTLKNVQDSNPTRRREDLGLFFTSMRRYLLSIPSLARLNIVINAPRTTLTTEAGLDKYQAFLQAALVHPALHTVSVQLGALPYFTMPDRIVSSPIKCLLIVDGEEPCSLRLFERMSRHFNLTKLHHLFFDSTMSSTIRKLLKTSTLDILEVRTASILNPPSVSGSCRTRNPFLHLSAFDETFVARLTGGLEVLRQASLTTMFLIVKLAFVTNSDKIASGAAWYLVGRALDRFKSLTSLTILFAGPSNETLALNSENCNQIRRALKCGGSSKYYVDIVSDSARCASVFDLYDSL
ncbi:hypothetical protein DL96DRAFT_1284594 [Flagelloscypha sp. PMI_526]|nr:hypothetical protein DL96DRAFT_1284594 [Flagelloscypha sp. PMI_526]